MEFMNNNACYVDSNYTFDNKDDRKVFIENEITRVSQRLRDIEDNYADKLEEHKNNPDKMIDLYYAIELETGYIHNEIYALEALIS